MSDWESRLKGRAGREAAACFVNELKIARLGALADAEGWLPIVLVIERLGKCLLNDGRGTLGGSKEQLIKLAQFGEPRNCSDARNGVTSEALVGFVVQGRNEEFHGGAAARRFVHHCLDLSIRLEDGLKYFMGKIYLRDVMAQNIICAPTWQPIYHARRLMLENSFTWLPLMSEGKPEERGISDHSLVAYIDGCPKRLNNTIEAAISDKAEPCLRAETLEKFDEHHELDGVVISALNAKPVLVSSSGHIIGIVTAFDLL